MNSRRMLWVAIVLASGCTASSGSPPTELNGATLYANNCNRCHEFRSPTEFNGPQWFVIMTHMRNIAGIPGDEARAVSEFLKTQRHPPYVVPATAVGTLTTPTSADPTAGRALVQQRGCVGCHVVEGQGGGMGPPLDGVSDRRSEAFVLQQLRNPKENSAASLMPNLGLAPVEIYDIWAYLQTLDGADGG